MSSSETRSSLPTGRGVLCSMPDCLFIAEMVVGGLVWILMIFVGLGSVPICWVMFCSVVCFLASAVWLGVFCCGANEHRIWLKLDAGYHVVATVMYLTASMCLAIIANFLSAFKDMHLVGQSVKAVVIVATVLAFITTILYFIHAFYSLMRSNRAGYTAI